MAKRIAAIDIGTHTARLLVVEGPESEKTLFTPLVRKRAFIRLADQITYSAGKMILDGRAIDGVLKTLQGFVRTARSYRIESMDAVVTGVLREVENKHNFLKRIREQTGIPVRLISGEEEAFLTEKGVLHALQIQASPLLVFDLGGGSTEFALREEGSLKVGSIPLGAAVLTRRFFSSVPPDLLEIERASSHMDCILQTTFAGYERKGELTTIGTGGTVVTLASMLGGVPLEEITPGRISGSEVKRKDVEALFHGMIGLGVEERLRLFGLDRGRADVILAGALGLVGILRFFQSEGFLVSFSDLLEGVLLERLELQNAGVSEAGKTGTLS